jgi:hypothetical protein
MRLARAALAVMALVPMLAGTASALEPVRPTTTPHPGPTAAERPSRLLIAIPAADAGAGAPGLADLERHLALADPIATVVVLPPDGTTWTVGAWHVTFEPAARPGVDPRLLVEASAGPGFSVDLPATRAADGRVDVVEVLGGPSGVTAWRAGDLVPSPTELRLPAWRLPEPGVDAVALDGAWWSLVSRTAAQAEMTAAPSVMGIRSRLARAPVSGMRRFVDASIGDVTGDGEPDLAVSFRRPFRRTLLNVSRPRGAWVDRAGMSAHVGLFRPGDLSSIWVAGTLLRPVHRLAACTGALAVTYSTLRRPTIVAATAWTWQGFGFLPMPELPGGGRPTCIDLDHDGRPDAAIIERG